MPEYLISPRYGRMEMVDGRSGAVLFLALEEESDQVVRSVKPYIGVGGWVLIWGFVGLKGILF